MGTAVRARDMRPRPYASHVHRVATRSSHRRPRVRTSVLGRGTLGDPPSTDSVSYWQFCMGALPSQHPNLPVLGGRRRADGADLRAMVHSSVSWPESVALLGLLVFAMFLLGVATATWLEFRKTKIAAAQDEALRQLGQPVRATRREHIGRSAAGRRGHVGVTVAHRINRTDPSDRRVGPQWTSEMGVHGPSSSTVE